MSGASDGVCVAHLARQANGVDAFAAFIASYRARPAGAAHTLLVICKGFRDSRALEPYDRALEGLAHEKVLVGDRGYDIGAYIAAARRTRFRHYFFLNSFSRFERDGWLEPFLRHGTRPGVGVAGATGSWQSVKSDYDDMDRFHPRHRMVFYKRWIIATDLGLRSALSIHRSFPPFPNPHVRTNAFFVARDALLGLRFGAVPSKRNTYLFESGTRSMTRQLRERGLEAMVVGADGRAYAAADWVESRTFWIREQENLLVSDNQTRKYAAADAATRAQLAHHAWRRFPDGREGSAFADPWP